MEMPRTLLHALHDRASALADKPALRAKRFSSYEALTWAAYAERVQHFALGLLASGFERGQTLAICIGHRLEWPIAQLGALAVGGVVVALEKPTPSVAIDWALVPAELAPGAQGWAKRGTISVDATSLENVPTFAEIESRGRGADAGPYWEAINALEPSTSASWVHVRSDCGDRVVQLTHKNLVASTARICQMLRLGADERYLSYLPISAMAEQLSALYLPLCTGVEVWFTESIGRLPEHLRECEPTLLFGVPSLWAQFQVAVEQVISELPQSWQRAVKYAMQVALDRHRRDGVQDRVPLGIEAQYELLRATVLAPLKQQLGLNRVRLCASSGAPLGKEVLEFFASIDVVIRELHGLAETSGPIAMNVPGATRLGSSGRPLLGLEVRIDEDDEIWVRGDSTFAGYASGEGPCFLDDGGWLHTGERGRIDGQGYLYVTGRIRRSAHA